MFVVRIVFCPTYRRHLMLKISRKICALFAIALIASASAAFAQLSTASMFGVVTDTTGAAIPNATVTLVQTDTQFTRVAKTKEDGSYHEEFLPIGHYKISVAAQGFKTLDRGGITLSVMQN